MTTCTVDGCDRTKVFALGMCIGHYERVRRLGEPGSGDIRSYGVQGCAYDGCLEPHHAHGWCRPHYIRAHRYGSPETRRRVRGVCEDPEGCDRPSHGLGLCTKHYQRARRQAGVS